MIATLNGVVSDRLADSVVLEVQGVGYGLHVTAEDHGRLSSGETVKVYIYEHIREQSHDLFGFLALDTKNLFEQLLEVNGVGPKMALNVLSIGTANDVRVAIAGGDVKFIQQANGVGKRVAERLVVDLKDKVGLVGVDLESTGLLQAEDSLLKDEAVEALVSLGYTAADAATALQKIDRELPTEDRIKQALKGSEMIVITGASDGLGKELAKLYKAENKTVVNVSRRANEEVSENLLHDLSIGDEIIAAAEEIKKLQEPIEALINCAGVFTNQKLGAITESEIKRTMATNVKAPILLVSNLIERIKHDGTDIVNVSSMAGIKPMANVIVYGASKWALRGFSADLQVELKDYNCRVISFCPGSFETDILEKIEGSDGAEPTSERRMPVEYVAKCLKQSLDLPKDMEIAEIIVNRKGYND